MKPVLVTTKHRGVFFGYLESEELNGCPEKIELSKCRNCLYWSRDVKGFIGLATSGPSGDCRIGPAVERITLFDVTSICEVSTDAAQKWEAAPWN